MDLMVYTTDPLIVVASSVAYDSDNGLAPMQFREWVGVGVSWNQSGRLQKSCVVMDGVSDSGTAIGSFECAVAPPPNGPPSLAPGTYRMGTIIWNTTGTTQGTEVVSAWINPLLDAVGAVINGNIVDVSTSVVQGSAVLKITPEPGTAALLGLGLVGLVVSSRRRRPRTP